MYMLALSPYHEIFYNEWKLSPDSIKYNLVFDQTVSSNLDIKRFKNALYRLISDYVILDSHVLLENQALYWVKNTAIKIPDFFSNTTDANLALEYAVTPFNLEQGPLYRFGVFLNNDNTYRLVLVFHHILIDGSSFNELIATVSHYYNDLYYKSTISHNQQIEQIKNTTQQLYNKIDSTCATSKYFWSETLQHTEAVDLRFIKLPAPKNNLQTLSEINELCFNFESNTIDELCKMTSMYGISNYFYGQVIFAILLYRYTSQEQFAISYPVAIREHVGLIYGAGVNTNCFPHVFNNSTTNIELIAQVKQKINQIKNNSYYPVGQIVAQSNTALLNVMFGKTNLKQTRFSFKDVDVLQINNECNIDLVSELTFEYEESNSAVHYRVRYHKKKIDKTILEKFVNAYKRLFSAVLGDLLSKTEKKIINYSILSAEEYQQIVYDWNNTQKDYPGHKTIHELFEEQVKKTPNNIAVVYKNINLTYNQLNVKANRLAHYLKETYQINGDDLVALCLDRNECMVIAILAVLKSGGAYVPIDPTYPINRIRYIINDIKTNILLTNKIYESKLNSIVGAQFNDNLSKNKAQCKIHLELIDNDVISSNLANYPDTNPAIAITSANLAYVIYTSGTTGEPKGVMVEHKSVVNLVHQFIDIHGLNRYNKVAIYSNYVFDAFVYETIPALISGNTIYLIDDKTRLSLHNLEEFIIEFKIEIMFIPPVLVKDLLENLYTKEHNLAVIYTGGEKLPFLDYTLISNLTLINEYGPTEATVCATLNHYKPNDSNTNIGRPIANNKIYILDNNLMPLPIGAIGELYIGGIGVARGYLNNRGLTIERFISNQFQTNKERLLGENNYLYKTGDLVRILADGNLEYIGRNDSQVKINGFRIELGEIESKLAGYTGIRQAVVLVIEPQNKHNSSPNNKYLVGYYIATTKLDEKEILKYLAEKLPYYMIPSTLKWLDNLPLTVNGKLDKKTLLNYNLFDNKNSYVAPRNNTESVICLLYTEVLQLAPNSVSINDDFFKFGGTSILAIRLVAKLQNYFTISVNDVFKLRTPEQIALAAVGFVKDHLQHQLNQVKLMYSKLQTCRGQDKDKMQQKYSEYLSNMSALKFHNKEKVINNILLTGASGYLGSNILYQLLTLTQYKIYLLVRAQSDKESYIKLEHKFKFYFNADLANYQHRIKVITSDIECPKLNLPTSIYQELILCIDSIIHCAALSKHYGDYRVLYSANVQATINLLELAKLTRLKDFHYISTVSVFINGYIPNCSYYVYNENDTNELLQNQENIYSRTKYEGELETIKYRKFGVNSNIYRVGNLSIHSQNYKPQENFTENAFFIRLKTMLNLGFVPIELAEIEISPVDYTALAIVKLFNQTELSNQTYHIFNPNKPNLTDLLSNNNVCVRMIHLNEFIDIVSTCMKNNHDNRQIELFMLHQSWLKKIDLNKLTKIDIVQDKTNYILNKLDFVWPNITKKMLTDIIFKASTG